MQFIDPIGNHTLFLFLVFGNKPLGNNLFDEDEKYDEIRYSINEKVEKILSSDTEENEAQVENLVSN